uniref:RING-type domain-containing protein n=1 Tax=Meloidogyne incognita TaxID=6306 RepID=A0A914N5U9_MELIC
MSEIIKYDTTIINNLPLLNNHTEKQQKQIPTEFICSLCKRVFEQPLLLSCGHSFCRKCLQPWLRKSTNCPFCRSTTLTPIFNNCLEEKILNFKKQNEDLISNGNNDNGFIRSFVRRSIRSVKVPPTLLQCEALRASQRKPNKGIVIPTKNEMENNSFIGVNVDKEDLKKEIKNEDKKENKPSFPRMGNLRRSFVRMYGKKNFTEQKINDCHSISTCFSRDEIISNKESSSTNVFPQNTEGISSSASLSSGFSPISSHSNISTTNSNKNINLSYSRLRAPSLGVSGSIIANNQSLDEPETLSKGKKRFGEHSSLNSNNTKNGCLLM